jgi:ATP-dependent Clp protease ATP-binding subunit ClpC
MAGRYTLAQIEWEEGMLDKYTERARRAIFFARYEARESGSPEIESHHILLGLSRDAKSLFAKFLRFEGSEQHFRKALQKHTMIGEAVPPKATPPLSRDSKRVLAFAAEEAERLGDDHIGTEHLLVGLMREEGSLAARMLHERGADLDQIRRTLAKERPKIFQRSDTPI